MFPYCVWNSAKANFKKNVLAGITMIASYIITDKLKQIDAKEKEDMAERIKKVGIISNLQWQKTVIMSIIKAKFDTYNAEFIKSVKYKDKLPNKMSLIQIIAVQVIQ